MVMLVWLIGSMFLMFFTAFGFGFGLNNDPHMGIIFLNVPSFLISFTGFIMAAQEMSRR